ncbi:MAG TPA: hypothetical protein VF618_19250 [Thermoanaerobaculia bacterium]
MKRFVFFAAIAMYFIGTIVWIASDRRISRQAFDEYSTANTSDQGLSHAYKYLQRSGRKVRLLTTIIRPGLLEPNAVVFRVGVYVSPFLEEMKEEIEEERDKQEKEKKEAKKKGAKPDEKKPGEKKADEKKLPEPDKLQTQPLLSEAEEEFVRGGGRLVIAVTGEASPLETRSVTDNTAEKVFPAFSGVETLVLPEPRAYTRNALSPRMHALYTAGHEVVMAREALGQGDIILLAAPELLNNQHLSGARVALLLGLAPKGRPIWFDEYVHGLTTGDGALALMKEWGLGPFLLLAAFATALLFWRKGKRVGPPDEEYRDTRSEAVDLVRSLGALYEKSTTEEQALAQYHDALTRTVAAQTGLRGDALHKRVTALTGGGALSLQSINDAFVAAHAVRRHGDAKEGNDAYHR